LWDRDNTLYHHGCNRTSTSEGQTMSKSSNSLSTRFFSSSTSSDTRLLLAAPAGSDATRSPPCEREAQPCKGTFAGQRKAATCEPPPREPTRDGGFAYIGPQQVVPHAPALSRREEPVVRCPDSFLDAVSHDGITVLNGKLPMVVFVTILTVEVFGYMRERQRLREVRRLVRKIPDHWISVVEGRCRSTIIISPTRETPIADQSDDDVPDQLPGPK
jgi:hypothetical protein